MSAQHARLAAGGWLRLTLAEQMANVGGEVERSLNWRAKNNLDYSRLAFERSLELIDLTLGDPKNMGRLRELARVREALVDFFGGANQYASSDKSWRGYFSHFAFSARRHT